MVSGLDTEIKLPLRKVGCFFESDKTVIWVEMCSDI